MGYPANFPSLILLSFKVFLKFNIHQTSLIRMVSAGLAANVSMQIYWHSHLPPCPYFIYRILAFCRNLFPSFSSSVYQSRTLQVYISSSCKVFSPRVPKSDIFKHGQNDKHSLSLKMISNESAWSHPIKSTQHKDQETRVRAAGHPSDLISLCLYLPLPI